MSDAVLVAVVAAIAGVVGGLVGAIAAPIGKDWVARREFERTKARETEGEKKRDQAERAGQLLLVSERMAEAMQHYTAQWKGIAAYRAQTEALRAGNEAWSVSRAVADEQLRQFVDDWKRQFDEVDMSYRNGNEPLTHDKVQGSYAAAAERLGELLRHVT